MKFSVLVLGSLFASATFAAVPRVDLKTQVAKMTTCQTANGWVEMQANGRATLVSENPELDNSYQSPYQNPYQGPYGSAYENPYQNPYENSYENPYESPYQLNLYQSPYQNPYEGSGIQALTLAVDSQWKVEGAKVMIQDGKAWKVLDINFSNKTCIVR